MREVAAGCWNSAFEREYAMDVQTPEWRGRPEDGNGSETGGPLEFDRLVVELSTRFGDSRSEVTTSSGTHSAG